MKINALRAGYFESLEDDLDFDYEFEFLSLRFALCGKHFFASRVIICIVNLAIPSEVATCSLNTYKAVMQVDENAKRIRMLKYKKRIHEREY